MAEHAKAALFLDTSIQIARMLHSSEMKKRIQERIDVYDRTATGLVVRQEFRRRVLKEAEYLLRLLHRYKSYDEVYHHVVRLPNSWRKMNANATFACKHWAKSWGEPTRKRLIGYDCICGACLSTG